MSLSKKSHQFNSIANHSAIDFANTAFVMDPEPLQKPQDAVDFLEQALPARPARSLSVRLNLTRFDRHLTRPKLGQEVFNDQAQSRHRFPARATRILATSSSRKRLGCSGNGERSARA